MNIASKKDDTKERLQEHPPTGPPGTGVAMFENGKVADSAQSGRTLCQRRSLAGSLGLMASNLV